MGAECGMNEKNRNTCRNLIATPKRKSILEFLLVYGIIVLKYILKRRGKHGLDSSISGYGRVVLFYENGHEPYNFQKQNNEFLENPNLLAFQENLCSMTSVPI